jgi:CubicO group peptidase (beta-lactamase class C family)
VIGGWDSPRGSVDSGSEPLFEIGSVTKVLTGTLLAEQHLRGEVDLDDPLTRHLDASELPRWRDRVPTLEDLATHRAALPNTPRPLARRELLAAIGVTTADPWDGVSDADYRRMLRAMRPRRRTDGRARALLERRVRTARRRARPPGRQLLRGRAAPPPVRTAAMAHTHVDIAAAGPALLDGHSPRGAARPPLRDCMPAAGSVRSSASDLLTFLHASLARRDDRLGEALALAQQPRQRINGRLAIGLGWMTLTRRGHAAAVWHNGGTWGFRSFVALVPDRALAIVVLNNTARSVDRLGFTLLDELTAPARRSAGR